MSTSPEIYCLSHFSRFSRRDSSLFFFFFSYGGCRFFTMQFVFSIWEWNCIILASRKDITASSAPWAFSHPAITCDFGTLAKYIFSKLLLLCSADRWRCAEEMRAAEGRKKVWKGDMREFMQRDIPCGSQSVRQVIFLFVCVLSPISSSLHCFCTPRAQMRFSMD